MSSIFRYQTRSVFRSHVSLRAFNSLTLVTYIELLDAAGFYREVMTMEEHEGGSGV